MNFCTPFFACKTTLWCVHRERFSPVSDIFAIGDFISDKLNPFVTVKFSIISAFGGGEDLYRLGREYLNAPICRLYTF